MIKQTLGINLEFIRYTSDLLTPSEVFNNWLANSSTKYTRHAVFDRSQREINRTLDTTDNKSLKQILKEFVYTIQKMSNTTHAIQVSRMTRPDLDVYTSEPNALAIVFEFSYKSAFGSDSHKYLYYFHNLDEEQIAYRKLTL